MPSKGHPPRGLRIYLGYTVGLPPTPSNSHKWSFRLAFPTKDGIILVVTVTRWGGSSKIYPPPTRMTSHLYLNLHFSSHPGILDLLGVGGGKSSPIFPHVWMISNRTKKLREFDVAWRWIFWGIRISEKTYVGNLTFLAILRTWWPFLGMVSEWIHVTWTQRLLVTLQRSITIGE